MLQSCLEQDSKLMLMLKSKVLPEPHEPTWQHWYWWRWYSPDSTMALWLLLAFKNSSCTGFRLCRTPLYNWFLQDIFFRTPFNLFFAAYSSFVFRDGFRSSWWWWCIAASMTLNSATWPQMSSTSLTSMHVSVCHRCFMHPVCYHCQLCLLSTCSVCLK